MTNWTKHVDRFILTMTARRDKKTITWYKARLHHWLKFTDAHPKKAKKIDTLYLDMFFGHLNRQGFAYSTRRGTLTAVKRLFKYLLKTGRIKHDPFFDFEPLAKERVEPGIISLANAYKLIRAAEQAGTIHGIRDAAIMRLLLSTGARRAEVSALQNNWIDFKQGRLKLKGKYRHERSAYLISSTKLALERWWQIKPPGSQAFFISLAPGRAGDCLHPNSINQILTRWAGRAGLPPQAIINPHSWRHRFATEMALSGDPFRLQHLMGHADISTTNVYIHNNPELLQRLVLRFAPRPPDQSGTGLY